MPFPSLVHLPFHIMILFLWNCYFFLQSAVSSQLCTFCSQPEITGYNLKIKFVLIYTRSVWKLNYMQKKSICLDIKYTAKFSNTTLNYVSRLKKETISKLTCLASYSRRVRVDLWSIEISFNIFCSSLGL